MKKKILIGLGLIGLIGVVFAFFQKPDVIDVTDKNKEHLGRQFKTNMDLLVFQYSGSKEWDLGVPGSDLPELKELPERFPYRWYGNKIYGVLPKGSVIRIVGAQLSTSKTMGGSWFMTEVVSQGPFAGRVVSTNKLEFFFNGQLYDPKYAVEVTTAQLSGDVPN